MMRITVISLLLLFGVTLMAQGPQRRFRHEAFTTETPMVLSSLSFPVWKDEGCIVVSREQRDNWNAIIIQRPIVWTADRCPSIQNN